MSELELLNKIFREQEKENSLLKEKLMDYKRRDSLLESDERSTKISKKNPSNLNNNNNYGNSNVNILPNNVFNEGIDFSPTKIDKYNKYKLNSPKDNKTNLNFCTNEENNIKSIDFLNFENHVPTYQSSNYNYVKEDFDLKLKIKEEEVSQIKEFYEKELKMKSDLYSQNISHLTKSNQEEIKKIRIEYENKIGELIKNNEEEKYNLMKIISTLENDLKSKSYQSISKKNLVHVSDSEDKNTDSIKKELQHALEQRDEIYIKYVKYKDNYKKIKDDYDKLSATFKERENNLENKILNLKNLLKSHKDIKNAIENTTNEIGSIKNQVNDLSMKTTQDQLRNKLLMFSERGFNENSQNSQMKEKIMQMEIYLEKMSKENHELKNKIDLLIQFSRDQTRPSEMVKSPSFANSKNEAMNKSNLKSEKDSKFNSKTKLHDINDIFTPATGSIYEEKLDLKKTHIKKKSFDHCCKGRSSSNLKFHKNK